MNKLDELAGSLANLMNTLQGPGLEAARGAARMEGYSALAAGVLCAVIGVAGVFALYAMWKREAETEFEEVAKMVIIIFGCVAILVILPIGLWNLVDPRTYSTITDPDLWIAKKALKL